jgi:hypothetical protein
MKKFPHGCFLPLNAIAVHPQGFPHFCLTSTLKTGATLNEFAEARREIHQQLLKGEWPATCTRCFNKEKRNLQSRRTRTWERKIKMYGREKAEALVLGQSEPTIRHLEISFSNVCNLTCGMCSSEFSTSWIAPDKAAIAQGLEFREFTTPFHRVARVSPALLEEVFAHVDDLDLIIIKGGEPTREPLCLNFLAELVKRRSKPGPFVFLQSNGTRHPKEWLKGLDSLRLEVGFSLDGWGPVNDWIRGSRFEQVVSHMEYLDTVPFVRNLTIDFTLSAYNVFHLREFIEGIISLRDRLKKDLTCPVFQWVQQPYSSPLALRAEDRLAIEKECRPLLEANPKLFLNFENLLEVLRQPQAESAQVKKCSDWLEYMNGMRKEHLPYQERLAQSLTY